LLAAAGAGAWWLRDRVLWPAPSPVFADGSSSGWLDFAEPDAGVPTVMASIGGERVEALLDSGAQSSVIDRGLAARLGLETSLIAPLVVAFGVSGAPRLGRTAQMDVRLGGLTLKGLHAAVFELAPVAAASGRGFGLILGQDVLKRVVADLDFPGARLAFHAPAAFAPPPEARAVHVRATGRELFVPVKVEDASAEALVDTGAAAPLALSMEAAETAGLLDGRPSGWAPSITFGGRARDRGVQVETASLLGRTWNGLAVHIYEPGAAAPLPSGLVGVAAFASFRTLLDVGRGRLHLIGG
jgi:predicted aspartyl protease